MKRFILAAVQLALAVACSEVQLGSDAMRNTGAMGVVPPSGAAAENKITSELVYMQGKQMYLWGWPMVNLYNRMLIMRRTLEPGLSGGALPVAPVGQLCMLSNGGMYDEHPNQQAVCGFGVGMLNESAIVVQVPDFGKYFWVMQVVNQRTDVIDELGAMHGSKSGFYLLVGCRWSGEVPQGITQVIRSTTDMVAVIPHVFLCKPEDREGLQPIVNQLMMYPVNEYDGTMKTKDWTTISSFPGSLSLDGDGRVAEFVIPERFFDILSTVMQEVPPMPGEEQLYAEYTSTLELAGKDKELRAVLVKAAVDTEMELMELLYQHNGLSGSANACWSATKDGEAVSGGYLHRMIAARTNIFATRSVKTVYYNQYYDSSQIQLDGNEAAYTVTLGKEMLPSAKGFWSLTVHDRQRAFYPNSERIYSLGTDSEGLQYNDDGSLTVCLQNKRPEGDKTSNWLPTPAVKFGLLLRIYCSQEVLAKEYDQFSVVKVNQVY